MAADAPNHIILLEIPLQHKELLGQLRHWSNLKIASGEDSIWVKDFTDLQLDSTELKAIPFTHLFEVKDNLLFLKGSLLPSKKLPPFLWTPIERALPVVMPPLNHNFFELPQKVPIRLEQVEIEQEASAMLVEIKDADLYMQSAPAVRLQPIEWIIIGGSLALMKGQPLLPLSGRSYWTKNDFIFPVGWGLEFSFLEQEIMELLNLGNLNMIWWMDELHYYALPKTQFAKLSISSWRASTQK
ncbi:MAG: hypothetical protein V4722_15165 [Bacteroidota bacterium]